VLVSLMIGANNAVAMRVNLPGRLPQQPRAAPCSPLSSHVKKILSAIRTRAHYTGQLAIVNYYSLDYADAAGTGLTQLLNQAIVSHAHADGAIVADAFSAFQHASASAAGHTCAAGLLNASPQNQFLCDVHPSQSGQELLAQAVVDAYDSATGN